MSECVVWTVCGRALAGPDFRSNPGGAHYLRVLGCTGAEVAHSTFEQWETDPSGEMGRIMGALSGGRPDRTDELAYWGDRDGDGVWGDESAVEVAGSDGVTLRFPPAGESLDYVRVCAEDGSELVYWVSDEWREDPELVCGALLGLLGAVR